MNKLFPAHSDAPLFRYFTDAERRRIEKIGDSPRTVSGGRRELRSARLEKEITLRRGAREPELLAKFSVALCELLVERLRDTARRV